MPDLGVHERLDRIEHDMRQAVAAGTKEIMVRLPVDLHAQLKERAEIDDRSMAATVRYAIKLYLRTEP